MKLKLTHIVYLLIFIFFMLYIFTKRNKVFEQIQTTKLRVFTVTKEEGIEALKSNDDGYISRLNDCNLKARNCLTVDDYFKQIEESVLDAQISQAAAINSFLFHIDRLNYINKYIDYKKFHDIPWNIILVKNTFENGLPHTRYVNNKPYIIIPISELQSSKLTRTLLHEKIHLYQKMYEDDYNKNILKNYTLVDVDEPLLRVNPDTDSRIFKCNKTGNVYLCKFNSENPENIFDVVYESNEQHPKFEHPFEFDAYEISKVLL